MQLATEYEARQVIIKELTSSQGDVIFILLERIKLYDLSLYLSLLHVLNSYLYFATDLKIAASAFNTRQEQDQVCLCKYTQREKIDINTSNTNHCICTHMSSLACIYTSILFNQPTNTKNAPVSTQHHVIIIFCCVQDMQRSRFGRVIKPPLSIDLPLPGTISGESASIVHYIHICFLCYCCVVMR